MPEGRERGGFFGEGAASPSPLARGQRCKRPQ